MCNGWPSAAHTKASSLLVVDACAGLSHYVPARIVCNSEVARRVHIARGYAATKMVVIPNGFDLGRLRPDEAARRAVRAELGLPDGALLVGLIGRYDPQKDHRGFMAAAGRLSSEVPEAHFLLAGEGARADNMELAGYIAQAGIGARVHLLGRRVLDRPGARDRRVLARPDRRQRRRAQGRARHGQGTGPHLLRHQRRAGVGE